MRHRSSPLAHAVTGASLLLAGLSPPFATAARSEEGYEREDALYGVPLPRDAVFVRTLVDCPTPQTLFGRSLTAADLPLDTYVALSAASLDEALPGRYYSLLNCDTPIILEPERNDPTKVYVILINGSDDPARLMLEGREVEIIGSTPAGRAAARGVNPAQASVRLEAGELHARFDLSLSRGQDLTFMVVNAHARLIENRFGPVLD